MTSATRTAPQGADEQRGEVERRLVGPVQVLHDHHQRPVGGEPPITPNTSSSSLRFPSSPAGARASACPGSSSAAAGPALRWPARAPRRARGVHDARQRAQAVDHRAEREAAPAELDAGAAEHAHVRLARAGRRLLDQPRLAQPASPPTTTTAGSPAAADSSAASSAASSSPLPTNTGLTRPGCTDDTFTVRQRPARTSCSASARTIVRWRAGRSSSSRSTPRARCTTTSASRSTACSSRGPCPRGRRPTRARSAWRSPSRTTRSTTPTSRARSGRAATARARSSCGTPARTRNRTERDGEEVPIERALADGHAVVELEGRKLRGRYALTRTGEQRGREQWLLVKVRDDGRRRAPQPGLHAARVGPHGSHDRGRRSRRGVSAIHERPARLSRERTPAAHGRMRCTGGRRKVPHANHSRPRQRTIADVIGANAGRRGAQPESAGSAPCSRTHWPTSPRKCATKRSCSWVG